DRRRNSTTWPGRRPGDQRARRHCARPGAAACGRATGSRYAAETRIVSMNAPDNAIAVVGMAGKFPGANNLSEFWSNLLRGKRPIVPLSEQELRDNGVSEKTLADRSYGRRAPLLDGIEEFDAEFFGSPPLAAQVLDPQHRLFLQCAWHAL